MKTGMLFTFLVSFIVFITATMLAVYMFRHKKRGDKKLSAYTWFWLITAGLWFFASFRILFGWLGMSELDRAFFEIDQFFVFASPIPLLYYLTLKIFKKENLSRLTAYGVMALSIFAIFLLFKHGISEGEATYFTTKFKPHPYAFNIFAAMAVLIIIFSGYDSLKRIARWIKDKRILDSHEFFYSLAILIYILIGVFDEKGFVAGWPLVFFRLSYLSVFLMVFLSFSSRLSNNEALIQEEDHNAQ